MLEPRGLALAGAEADGVDDAVQAVAAAAGAQLRDRRCQARVLEQAVVVGELFLARGEIRGVAFHGRREQAAALEVLAHECHGGLHRPPALDDDVDEAGGLGFLRVQGPAGGDQAHGLEQALFAAALVEAPGQALRAAVARQQVQVDLRLAEARVPVRDHAGAGEHELAAAAEGRAVDRRHHRLAEVLEQREGRVRGVRRGLRGLEVAGLAHLQQFLDVGAGHESAAGTGDHQGLDVVLVGDVLEHGVQLVEGALVQGIHRRRVDHQQRHLAAGDDIVGLDPQVPVALHDLPRLGELAEGLPLRHGVADLVDDLRVAQGRQVTERVFEEQRAQRPAHVLAGAGLREGGDDQEVRGHGGDAFLGAHQPLQAGEVVVAEARARRGDEERHRRLALLVVRRTDDHGVAYRGIRAQGLVAKDCSLDLLGADAVARDVDHVVGAAVQRDAAVVELARVVALRIGEAVAPAVEIDLGEALDVAAPVIRAQFLRIAPDGAGEVGVGLGEHEFAFLARLGAAPAGGAARLVGFRGDAHLGLDPGQRPGARIGL